MLVSVVTMVTVLEEQRYVVGFLWAKGLNGKDIYKKLLSVYGGVCLPRKEVHNWVDKFSQGRSKVTDDARQGAEEAETSQKRLLCCEFRRSGKAMGQVYQCWWRICRELNVFPRFEYHMFYVLYPFVTYLLTRLRRNVGISKMGV
jgi:hypothetical protein